jgi:hypothetical protein
VEGYCHFTESEESEMNVTTIGLDIAKNVFQVHGCDKNGKAVIRKQLGRNPPSMRFGG